MAEWYLLDPGKQDEARNSNMHVSCSNFRRYVLSFSRESSWAESVMFDI